METFKYRAFISYSHKDERWGKWMHRKLESFRVPSQLIGKRTKHGVIPGRLFPIFRDREELPSSARLGEAIRDRFGPNFGIFRTSNQRHDQQWRNWLFAGLRELAFCRWPRATTDFSRS